MEDLKAAAEKSADPNAGSANAAPAKSKFARLGSLSRLHLVLGAVAIVTGLVLVAAIALRPGKSPTPLPVNGDRVLAALDSGDLVAAEQLAEALRDRNPTSLPERVAFRYVLGIAQSERAERIRGATSIKLHREAAENLAHAAEFGFSEGREEQGLLRLGKSLLYSGQPEASREPLRAALARGFGNRLELERLLAEACLREPRPEPKAARAHIEKYLANPRISSEDRKEAELLRAEILIKLGSADEVEQALQPLLADATTRDRATILQARQFMEQGRQQLERAHLENKQQGVSASHEIFQRAIDLLRKVQADAPRNHEVNSAAMYLIGHCYLSLEDSRAALDQFERTSKRYLDLPEGWASLVETSALRLEVKDYAQAQHELAEAIRLSQHYASGNNRWVSQEMLRDHVIALADKLVERGAFSEAIALASGSVPPLTKRGALELRAKANQAWGRKLLAHGQQAEAGRTERATKEGRVKLREAGALFDELARERFATNFYLEDRWNAAACYLEAQNYPLAVEHLRDYVERAPRRDRPRALLALGKAYLAMGQYQESVDVLKESIHDHPRHPAQFEARVLMSSAYFEQGDTASAERALLENLEGDLLTPASKEWRESLFALGRLLHDTGRFSEAAVQLQAALRRYPEDHQALAARYLLADCHLQIANQLNTRLQTERVEETRRLLLTQRNEQFEQAVADYRIVTDRLSEVAAARELTPVERAMASASSYNRAASLMSLERHREAYEAYNSAINRDRSAPEALAGYVQIADCARRAGQRDQSQTALALAGAVLSRMPADADFAARTGFNRDTWSNYIAWLRQL